MGYCKEKPEKDTVEEGHSKRLLVAFAVWLGITILVSGLLDLFAKGLPLGFIMPILNLPATLSMILYYVAILIAAIYIGAVGLKELVLERRFSVEFLMAVAGLGALFLDYRFEAATVLFLYCLAEYFEG
ncbi:MAG TPA: hypothetical protein VF350_08400, partial [Candidatus Bathyarchaeia archaeon]